MFLPVNEKYIINQDKGIVRWKKTYALSRWGLPKSEQTEHLISDDGISIEKSRIENTEIRIKTNEKEILLEVNYPGYSYGKAKVEVEKYLGQVDDQSLEDSNNIKMGDKEGDNNEAKDGHIDSQDPDVVTTLVIRNKMKKDIRSWGNSSLLLGAVHLISFGVLAPSWGVILLLVGLASFIFESASLFVVYAVSLAWVGMSNIIQSVRSDLGFWTFFGLYQIFLAYRVFKKFGIYKDAERKFVDHQAEETRSKKVDPENHFAWIGTAFSWGALIIYLVIFVLAIIALVMETDLDPLSKLIDLILNIMIGFGVIGIAFSLSAILSKYKRGWMAWLGLAGGVLLLVIHFSLLIL